MVIPCGAGLSANSSRSWTSISTGGSGAAGLGAEAASYGKVRIEPKSKGFQVSDWWSRIKVCFLIQCGEGEIGQDPWNVDLAILPQGQELF